MRLGWARPTSLVNGRVLAETGEASAIRVTSRVVSFDERPRPGDAVVDLEGAFLLPGLINAHDHLELNHYGPLKFRPRYDDAADWIDEMRPALEDDADICAKTACPLRDRLFIGGLKNLLAGVTTVAHHNPRYRELRDSLHIRALERFGWAHSLGLEGLPVGAHGECGAVVKDALGRTPRDEPFIVHVGEGVDARAADELRRLENLGCLTPNMVMVHAVAMSRDVWARVLAAGASLIWCPASNDFLFGRTVDARMLLDAAPDAWQHLCLGSDSRVTGANDLLDELRVAKASALVTSAELLRMVTSAAARVLRSCHGGHLRVGAPADFIVLSPKGDTAADALLEARRVNVLCVAVGGRPRVAHSRFAPLFEARRVRPSPIEVDGAPRLASVDVARGIARCQIQEPGVASRA